MLMISSCSSCTPYNSLNHGQWVPLHHTLEDLQLPPRVRWVPGLRLAEEASVQDRLLVGEGVKAEGSMVGAHAALPNSSERQVWICELQ